MSEPAAPPRPPSPAKFEPSPATRAVVSVAALLSLALAVPQARAQAQTSETIGYFLGVLAVAVGVPLLVGWIGARRGAGSAGMQRPVIITAIVLLTIRLLNVLVLAALGSVEAYTAASRDTGRAFLDEQVPVLQAKQAAYEARVTAFMDGLYQQDDLASPATIDARLELLRQAHAEGSALDAAVQAFPAEAKARMHGPEGERAYAAFMRGYDETAPLALKIRESELRLLDAHRQMLTILRDQFGQWTLDPNSGVTFDEALPEADKKAYERATANVDRETAELARLQALGPTP